MSAPPETTDEGRVVSGIVQSEDDQWIRLLTPERQSIDIAVDAIGTVRDKVERRKMAEGAVRSGVGGFLYLEVLDASFSFDGVIGAFALSNNMLIIALGLSIGALFVRSMTVHLVRAGTLTKYRFLEHGAFWAIIALGLIMLLSAKFHISESITGLIGAVLIGISLLWSMRYNRKHGRSTCSRAPLRLSGAASSISGDARSRSSAPTSLPSAMITARFTRFSSSRTLPGHLCASSAASASGAKPFTEGFISCAKRLRKALASSAASPGRSLSEGMRTTLSAMR